MAKFTVCTRAGKEVSIEGVSGVSFKDLIQDAGLYELEGICGGVCSCATCHVQFDPAAPVALPQMKSDEEELLSESDHYTEKSRLSCQIVWSDEFDGVRLTIAPED